MSASACFSLGLTSPLPSAEGFSVFLAPLFSAFLPAFVKSRSTSASTTFSLPATALSCAASLAVTVIAPAELTGVLRMNACACAGSWPLNADEMSGSPSSASTALKRMFDGFQPIELKTRTTLTAVHASMLEVDVASICAVFSAETVDVADRRR